MNLTNNSGKQFLFPIGGAIVRIGIWLFLLAVPLLGQQTKYSYDKAGRLVGVVYPNGRSITYTYDPAGNLLRRGVTQTIAGPTPVATAEGVVNAASFLGGPVAPGEIITIFGTDIGPATLTGASVTNDGFLSTTSGETMVLFDGTPAPMVYASAKQTSVVVPYSVSPPSTQMVVVVQGRQSNPVTLAVTAVSPALFSFASSGTGNGAILNQDGSVNTPANPAEKGAIIVLFGTGEGQTEPAGMTGKLALSAPYPTPIAPVKVKINGVESEVLYKGAAPFLVAGLIQVNVRIPENTPSGAIPVVLMVGDASSQENLTVSVK